MWKRPYTVCMYGFGERAGAKAGTSSIFPQDMLVATVTVGGRTGVREVAARAGCNPVLLLCSVCISPCGPKFWSRSSKGVGFLLSVMAASALICDVTSARLLGAALPYSFHFLFHVHTVVKGWVRSRETGAASLSWPQARSVSVHRDLNPQWRLHPAALLAPSRVCTRTHQLEMATSALVRGREGVPANCIPSKCAQSPWKHPFS